MSDLSEKLQILESNTADRHGALLDVLAGIKSGVDALALALAPDPAAPTLAGVIAAIETGNATAADELLLLGDVHLDTMSMDGKLLTMRDTLGDVHLDTMSMDQKLLTMRNDLANLLLEGLNITSATRATHDRAAEIKGDTAGLLLEALNITSATRGTHDRVVDVINILDRIDGALGVPAGESPQSIRQILQSQLDCACPPDAFGEGCTAPYISTGMTLIPFALWPTGVSVIGAIFEDTPPDGIEYATSWGPGDPSLMGLYSANWEGWRVFVQSDQEQFSWDSISTVRHSTNVWIDMPPGPGEYAFSVRDLGGLVVTLCPAEAPPNPETAYGWFGLNDFVPNNGGTFEATPNHATMEHINPETMAPPPRMAIGDTLYIKYCHNATPHANKSIYLAYNGDDESSIFHELVEDEIFHWVVEDVTSIRMWVWGRPFSSPQAGAQIVYAWTLDDLDHCEDMSV